MVDFFVDSLIDGLAAPDNNFQPEFPPLGRGRQTVAPVLIDIIKPAPSKSSPLTYKPRTSLPKPVLPVKGPLVDQSSSFEGALLDMFLEELLPRQHFLDRPSDQSSSETHPQQSQQPAKIIPYRSRVSPSTSRVKLVRKPDRSLDKMLDAFLNTFLPADHHEKEVMTSKRGYDISEN